MISIFESDLLELSFLVILSWEKGLNTSLTETRLRFEFILFLTNELILVFNISIFAFFSCLLALSSCLLFSLLSSFLKGSFLSLSSTFNALVPFTFLDLTRLKCSTGLLSCLTCCYCFFFLENFTSLHDLLFSYLDLLFRNSDRLSILCLFDLLYGGFHWFSFFINDCFTLMIFKLTFIVDHNYWSSFLLFFNNFRGFNDLLFCDFNLLLSCFNGLTIFC